MLKDRKKGQHFPPLEPEDHNFLAQILWNSANSTRDCGRSKVKGHVARSRSKVKWCHLADMS